MRTRVARTNAIAIFALTLLIAHLPTAAAVASDPVLEVTADTTLTADFVGAVVITADGVTLDCAGHSILGPGDIGVSIGASDVSVANCHASGFNVGFLIDNQSGSQLSTNTSEANVVGFQLSRASNSRFTDNEAQDNEWASFQIDSGSKHNRFQGDIADSAFNGFVFDEGSHHNTCVECEAYGQDDGGFGFVIAGGAHRNTLRATAADGQGISYYLENTWRNDLVDNTSYAAEWHGFALVEAHHNSLRGNTSSNENPAEMGGAFSLERSRNNDLIANEAHGALGAGYVVGVGSDRTHLTRNVATFSHDFEPGGPGIIVTSSAQVRVERNSVVGYWDGIIIETSADARVDRNTVEAPLEGTGILIVESTNSAVTRNQAVGGNQGFTVIAAPNTRLTANRSLGAYDTGFGLIETSDTTLSGNRTEAFDPHGYPHPHVGFSVYHSDGQNTLRENRANGADGAGFLVVESTGTDLRDNVAVDGQGAGFVEEFSADVRWRNNRALRNGTGFASIGSHGSLLQGNVVRDSAGTGIFIEGSEHGTLRHNDTRRNGGSGILLIGTESFSVERNVARSNGQAGGQSAGIYVYGSVGATVHRNVACGNSEADAVDEASADTTWANNDFCTPLEVREGELPGEEPVMHYVVNTGDLFAGGYEPDQGGFAYLAGGDPDDPASWVPSANVANSDGEVQFLGVAAELPHGDWVGIRNADLDIEIGLMVSEITFDTWTGDSAFGTAHPDLIGVTIFLCYDDTSTDTGDCYDVDVQEAETGLPYEAFWEELGLGLSDEFDAFIQVHDDVGNVQETRFPWPMP